MLKRIIYSILILFVGSSAFAAWTNEITDVTKFPWDNGQTMYMIKLECTSDAGASGDITLSSQLSTDSPNDLAHIKNFAGGLFFALEYVPDSADAPTAAPTITVDTESGTLVFSEVVAVAGTGEMFDGSVDAGFNFPLTDLIIALTTLADTKKAVLEIWILK